MVNEGIGRVAVSAELDAQGSAVVPQLLSRAECEALAALYPNDVCFRSTVVMARHGFGRGEYRYFSNPLPDAVARLRTEAYAQLAPIANRWHAAMGVDVRFPDTHAAFIERCHAAGQRKPTPLLLQYGPGDYNCLHQGVTMELFEHERRESLAPGSVLLRGFALHDVSALLADLESVIARAPFRHMVTPGGFRMSVAMTNCGALGWVTERSGYRYEPLDPVSGQLWPRMPASFSRLATRAATEAGFGGFVPDACLVNRYEPGTRLSLHQDRNERDYAQPIVSVSLGLPATFLFGGTTRSSRAARLALQHGDVVVWGGPARLRYHGVLPLAGGEHPLLGRVRINLTFRKAG